MAELNQEAVKKALSTVMDPELGNDLVSLDMVKDIQITGGSVKATVELTTAGCPLKAKIESDCKDAINKVDGVTDVEINFTSRPLPIRTEVQLPTVKKIIAISSGKGGVGKSTVSINIARAFKDAGYNVGLVDADIYGPNIPPLLENYNRPNVTHDDKLVPVEHNGIKFISMGLLLEPGQPIIWRGPMLHGVIKQFLGDVIWGDLDYLFIDLPPGTGDVHLSLCQMVDMEGAIIVTTPQQLSVADVRKGIGMFRQLQVDIIGIVENMSYYLHPGSEEKIYVFGKDGGKKLAEEWNLPLLSQIPIDPAICENSENGTKYLMPIVEKVHNILESKVS